MVYAEGLMEVTFFLPTFEELRLNMLRMQLQVLTAVVKLEPNPASWPKLRAFRGKQKAMPCGGTRCVHLDSQLPCKACGVDAGHSPQVLGQSKSGGVS